MPASPRRKQNPAKPGSSTNKRVCLIHWNVDEALGRAAFLRDKGYPVARIVFGPGEMKKLRQAPPAAIVIDLTRLPSHGRDAALSLREQKWTRMIPLVFVEGDSEKVAGIRRMLPDASFTTWKKVSAALKRAIVHPPADPVGPKTRLDGYSGTPLPKKLGIKPGFLVELVDAPDGIEKTLGDLPEGVRLVYSQLSSRSGEPVDLALWFIHSQSDLARGAKAFGRTCPPHGIWFHWRKKTAAAKSIPSATPAPAFGEKEVRAAGLAAGLVDFKVCAFDATWSGLKFARRKK